jgi:predicted nucleic acid-binding protein
LKGLVGRERLVVDASVAVKWLVEEEWSAAALGLRERARPGWN